MPVVIAWIIAEPLKQYLHILVTEGEALVERLEGLEVFLGERAYDVQSAQKIVPRT